MWSVLYQQHMKKATHFEVDMRAALYTIYTTCLSISVLRALPCQPSLSFQLNGKIRLPPNSFLILFFFPFLSISLWGNWRLAARHRPTNIMLPWPIHLHCLGSASHLLSSHCWDSSCFCVSNMGNGCFMSLAKHLKIGLCLYFYRFPTWFLCSDILVVILAEIKHSIL